MCLTEWGARDGNALTPRNGWWVTNQGLWQWGPVVKIGLGILYVYYLAVSYCTFGWPALDGVVEVICLEINNPWASLVAQWLRICLPMQGTWVCALVWEDPICRGAAGLVSHNYWACASGACAPQQERPRRWKARAPQWRVAPLAATRESPHTEMKTQHSQK